MTLRQQKISSLRRKDTMWIYKNPQGLLMLEDELNERRKRRSARHRSSPPLSHNRPEVHHKQQQQQLPQQEQEQKHREETVLTPPAMQLTSPSDVLIPIAKKAAVDVKPVNNMFIEKPLKKPTITESPTSKESKQPLKPAAKANLIEERLKQLKSSSSSSSNMPKDLHKQRPKLVNATSDLKQKAPLAKPRSLAPTQDDQYLSNVKQKLSPVKPKVNTDKSKVAENDSPVAPPRRRGLVSSFVSAFEAPSPDVSSPSRNLPTRSQHTSKPRALADVKPIASQSYNPVSSSRLVPQHELLPPIKPRRQAVMPSPSTTVSSPALSTPSPFTTTTAAAVAPTDSYFPIMTTVSLPEQKQATLNEPEIKISPSLASQMDDSVLCSNEINVYLPQLSPEISFHEDVLEDVSAGEQEEDSDDEPLDKEVASVLERPEIKKRVSFSDQLLTYIPEQQASDDDTASNKSNETSGSSSSPKNPMLGFSRALSSELSDIKAKLIAERKVNTTPSREEYVPAAVTRKLFEAEVAPKRPSVANVHAPPQKLSNKLLDMFQQKLSAKPSPVAEHPQLPKTQQPESRGLVHLTKSRPRKPPSLKKPTYPAATAQPNWRERATNRKYEFIA